MDYPESPVKKANEDELDMPARREPKVTKVSRVKMVHQDCQVFLVNWVHVALQAPEDSQGLLEIPEFLELKVFRELREILDHKANLEHLDKLDLLGRWDLLDLKETWDHLVFLDRMENLAYRDCLELMVHQVAKEILE